LRTRKSQQKRLDPNRERFLDAPEQIEDRGPPESLEPGGTRGHRNHGPAEKGVPYPGDQ